MPAHTWWVEDGEKKMARTLEQRMQELEDREAIRQVICGYGYAVDGCNADAVGSFYVDDGVYAIGDIGVIEGRTAIEAITRDRGHLELVAAGVAHMSSPPYITIEGDQAVATCHTMVPMHGENGFFIGRLSASRIQLGRQPDGSWKIVHRQNWILDGGKEGPAMLGRLKEGARKS
jgi:ketosteroid isomerase-like protein